MASAVQTHKIKSKPPPLRLDPNPHSWPLLNPLAEFAAIATSPQSPLVRQTTCEGGVYDVTSFGHLDSSFLPALVPDRNFKIDDIACTTPSPIVGKVSAPSGEDSDNLSSTENPLSYSWSASLWQRLAHGTSLQFHDMIPYPEGSIGFSGKTANSAMCATGGLTRDGRMFSNEKNVPALFGSHDLTERESEIPVDLITLENNSLVQASPWSPFYPDKTLNRYDIPCRDLVHRDINIPGLSRSDEATTPSQEPEMPPTPVVERTVLFDLDSAAHALNTMAKRKEEHDRYNRKAKPQKQIVKRKGATRVRKNRNEGIYAKRPMNAFMLFAKRYRLEITQKHPGKDNRAISVILGDQWKSMDHEDRKRYVSEAKLLADEHKRIYPDCWKRKRTTKVPSTVNRKS